LDQGALRRFAARLALRGVRPATEPEEVTMYHNILVPIALEDERDPARALDVARKLCAPGANVSLLHVMDEVPTYAVNYLPQGYRDDLRSGIKTELTRIAAGLGQDVRVEVIEGRPGRAIIEWARENGVDCIVIASHRPGMQDYFIGSTAARVVRHALCSVHILR
jgi:universal stress protein F